MVSESFERQIKKISKTIEMIFIDVKKRSVGETSRIYKDYEVSGLFGDDFKFNKFSL